MKYVPYLARFIFSAILLSMSNYANAASVIAITDAYIKATIPGTEITAAYMTLKNTGDKENSLLKVTSSISDQIEIHSHSMNDGMMRMRKEDKVIIHAGDTVKLQPMGLHLMIFDVKQQLTEKDKVPISLYFSDGSVVNLTIPVKSNIRLPVSHDK